MKLRRWATVGSDDYGLPGLPLALASAAGLWWLWRERRRESWTLVLGGWLGVWIGFTALGILTSGDDLFVLGDLLLQPLVAVVERDQVLECSPLDGQVAQIAVAVSAKVLGRETDANAQRDLLGKLAS